MKKALLPALALVSAALAEEIVFQPFEGDGFGAWEETGTAFGKGPSVGGPGRLAGKVSGYVQDSFACSLHPDDQATGSLTSPEFSISLPYITFLIGGGSTEGSTCVQLLVQGSVKFEAVGQDDQHLRPHTWDVTELKGQRARIRIFDNSPVNGGYIMADHVVFTDTPTARLPLLAKKEPPPEVPLVPSDAIPGMNVPEGTEVSVWATNKDHQLYSPTALCIDENGRLLVTETHRFRFGIPDNRDHRYWHADDIASTTTDDRRKLHEKWNDRHSVESMTERSEKIRLLVDSDGNGQADVSKIFADGFNDLLDGIAAGIYSLEGETFFACIPHIWKLSDQDNDGVAETKSSLFDGFGVRVSLSGHDLNGFALGPDGRLYGTIGDRAMNVRSPEGLHFALTDQGAAFRFDPDGSNFEVIHHGLRNPKELAFDEFGNAITVDNNSDQGDKARVVYLMEGADSGWRTDHQNLHTFFREIGYDQRPINQWMQERQWDEYHEDQPAFLVPPIAHLTSGPSGLTYHPGSGYSENCAGSFLVCDYRGGAAASGIWAFGIETDGAGMRMINPRKFNWGAAVTDLEFGYDGRLYVTDFGGGWKAHEGGRIYTLSTPESRDDPTVREVAKLFRDGFSRRTNEELDELMSHQDLRVRLRAQLALAQRPESAPLFIEATTQTENRLQRLHGVWGLWIKARKERSEAATAHLLSLLGDPDGEIRAQAARALGEAPVNNHLPLINSLQDPSSRVRAFAALSLSRLRVPAAFNAILVLLADNGDRDPYLRHAGVMGLLGCGTEDQISALLSNPSRSLRLASVLALRRLRSPNLIRAFFDEDPFIADEAIRAVHDTPIDSARLAVAALLDEYAPDGDGRSLSRMMLRRLLHSAFRVGGPENAARLLRVAANKALDRQERLEALRLVSIWETPPPSDQSLGRHAPLPRRDLDEIRSTLEREIPKLVTTEGEVLAATIGIAAKYNLAIENLDEDHLLRLLNDKSTPSAVRAKALGLLFQQNPASGTDLLPPLVKDEDPHLASTALDLLVDNFPELALEGIRSAIASDQLSLRQQGWIRLRSVPGEEAADLLAEAIRQLTDQSLDLAVALEVLESATRRKEPSVKKALADYEASLPPSDALAPFRVALQGGNPQRGEALFQSHPAAQCLRCHRVDSGKAPDELAGPNLAGIAKRQTPEYLLESLIEPGKEVASGFGVVALTFRGSETKTGLLISETEETLDLLEGDDLWRIQKADIQTRSHPISAMPAMGALLTKHELRDLMAWLSSLKKGDPTPVTKHEPKPLVLEPSTAKSENPAPPSAPTQANSPDQTEDLPPIDPAVMELGRVQYLICHACHGSEGQGAPNLGPPLAGSEWVTGPIENLIRIQMRGLTGPIEVAGQSYSFTVPMAPLHGQTDEQIAAVLTYVRNSFGNRASPVTPEMIAPYRKEIGLPMLTVDDLIDPTAGDAAPSSSSSDSPTRISFKTILIVGAIILWCGLCLVPFLKNKNSSSGDT